MTTYYVDGATGSNANTGTSESTAWQTITYACASVSSGDTIYVKASQDYEETVEVVQSMTEPTSLIGYTSSLTDGGKVTVQGSNTRSYNLSTYTQSNHSWHFKNFVFESATSRSMYATSGFHSRWIFENCVFRKGIGTATTAASFGNYNSISDSHFINCVFEDFTANGINAKGTLYFVGCIFRNNGGGGCYSDNYTTLYAHRCLFANNAGHGFRPKVGYVFDCTFYENGYSAVSSTNIGLTSIKISNSLIVNHTNTSYSAINAGVAYGCAFFNNHTKASSSASTKEDIDLTSDPFVNAASGDFSISISSAVYSSLNHLQGVDHRDIGAIQHQDPSGGTKFHPLS